MSDYNTLYDEYKRLASNRSTETPTDLTTILDELDVVFSNYKRASSSEVEAECLEEAEDLLRRYKDISKVVNHVTLTLNPTNLDTLFYEIGDFEDEETELEKEKVIRYGLEGERILEKVHRESALRKKDNEIHQLFVELIGRFFDDLDPISESNKYILKYATGIWLDELAKQYGITRYTDETDNELRKRILQRFNERFTTPQVRKHDITFFTCVNDPKTRLTSKNTYLTNDYLCYGEDVTEEYFELIWVCWRDIIWL